MVDDMGYGDLGCYGQKKIKTPNIDKIASEGIRFTNCYSGSTICAPSRSVLMTGQHTGHTCIRGNMCAVGGTIGYKGKRKVRRMCLTDEDTTVGHVLQKAGYRTCLVGKWHLGANLHPQEGFTFWVTKPHGHSLGFYDQEVIEDGKTRVEPTYLTDLWTDRGIEFIESNKDRPFFLFLAYNGPYGLGGAMHEPIRNRHQKTYADATLPSFPRLPAHPWNHNYGGRIGELEFQERFREVGVRPEIRIVKFATSIPVLNRNSVVRSKISGPSPSFPKMKVPDENSP